jgi:hypothetical protein
MGLEQFDKLARLVEKLINNNREARFKIVQMEKEISELKIQLDKVKKLPENADEELVQDLLTENERLKTKNQTVRNHLDDIVTNLEQKIAQ